jgi:hypothetical protein
MSTTFLVPKNNANGKLLAAITAAATSLSLLAGEGARFPSTYPFNISIDNEILQVTNRATDTMTVTRAQEGTVAAIHSQSATVQLNITAKAISDLNTAVNVLETAPPAHKTSHQSAGSDAIKLDDLAAPDDNTDLDVATTKHGLTPKLPNDVTKFLDGLGAWSVPAGSGGSSDSCHVPHSVAQSVPQSNTVLAFDTERWDTNSMHDNVTNNSRLTCKTAGKYLVCAQCRFASNATGGRTMMLRINGSTIVAITGYPAINGDNTGVGVMSVLNLAVNDYVETLVYQNSGGNLNITKELEFSPEFAMARIGA